MPRESATAEIINTYQHANGASRLPLGYCREISPESEQKTHAVLLFDMKLVAGLLLKIMSPNNSLSWQSIAFYDLMVQTTSIESHVYLI